MFRKSYLVAYNLAQLAGWSYVGVLLLPHLAKLVNSAGHVSGSDAYADCSAIVRLFQVGAYLEVMHNLTGLVKGNPVLTMSQVRTNEQKCKIEQK